MCAQGLATRLWLICLTFSDSVKWGINISNSSQIVSIQAWIWPIFAFQLVNVSLRFSARLPHMPWMSKSFQFGFSPDKRLYAFSGSFVTAVRSLRTLLLKRIFCVLRMMSNLMSSFSFCRKVRNALETVQYRSYASRTTGIPPRITPTMNSKPLIAKYFCAGNWYSSRDGNNSLDNENKEFSLWGHKTPARLPQVVRVSKACKDKLAATYPTSDPATAHWSSHVFFVGTSTLRFPRRVLSHVKTLDCSFQEQLAL